MKIITSLSAFRELLSSPVTKGQFDVYYHGNDVLTVDEFINCDLSTADINWLKADFETPMAKMIFLGQQLSLCGSFIYVTEDQELLGMGQYKLGDDVIIFCKDIHSAMSCGTEKKKNVRQRVSKKPAKALIPKDAPGNVKEQTSPEPSENNASDTKEKNPKTPKRKMKQAADPAPVRQHSAPRTHYQTPDNIITRLTEIDPGFAAYPDHLAAAIKESKSPQELEFTLPFYIASSLIDNAFQKISPVFPELKDALKNVKLSINTIYTEDGVEID
ncbi:MAG: hypothetical protein J6N70_00480 [Oribacterium sp.]|nr:hypothetical protein [Oribacterium sp.]